jgi:hypothetical protein
MRVGWRGSAGAGRLARVGWNSVGYDLRSTQWRETRAALSEYTRTTRST